MRQLLVLGLAVAEQTCSDAGGGWPLTDDALALETDVGIAANNQEATATVSVP